MSWLLVCLAAGIGAVAGGLVMRWRQRVRAPLTTTDEHRLLRQILARMNVLLWRGRVRRIDGRFVWEIDVPTELYDRPLLRLAASLPSGGLWRLDQVPELPEMTARAERALREGAAEYSHQFQVITRPGDSRWLSEEVTIERQGDDEWVLTGMVRDYTAQREAEVARVASETRLQQVLKRADCLVWYAQVQRTADDTFEWDVHFPPSVLQERVFGPPVAGERGVYDRVEIPEAEEMHARSSAALRSGASGYAQEFRVVREAQTFWLSEQVSISSAGDGRWDLVGVTVDVTAQRQAEEARRAADAQLAQLVTRADCLVWQARVVEEADGTFRWYDTFFPRSALDERIYGGRAPNRPGIWEPHRTPDLPEMCARSDRALREGLAAYEQEFRFIGCDGRIVWLHEQVSITREAPGHWSCVGVATDVTDRRSAEAALAAEKERLNVTLHAMEEGVITVDVDGRLLFMNRAAGLLSHLDAAGGIGHPIEEVCTLVEFDTGRSLPWPVAPVLREGRVVDLPVNAAVRPPGGSAYPVEGCCAPMRDPDGDICGAVLVFRDVTERHRLKTELQRASKLESIGLLAGGIAHDFNNILTAIMGNISVAALDAADLPQVHHPLDEAERACIRARDLTQQLLTFAKGGEPILAALRLPGIIRECAEFALHGSRVVAEFDLPDDLWPANADRGQVAQIVQNLVINSVQAMPEGGSVRITARNTPAGSDGPSSVRPGDYVRFSIADTGVGIRPEDLGKVFDPYFTTKKQGSGLGLATAYSIVKRHGGSITVQSSPGAGSTFHVWLPALREAAIGDAPHVPAAQARLQGRVLIMDDEEAVRFAVSKLAQRLGLTTETAPDGRTAVDLCRAALARGLPFDLVIMDLTIPGGMGGAEALREIRQFQPGVRAIVSSGYSSDPVMGNHRHYGFDGVMAKPYSAEEFARVLRDVLTAAHRVPLSAAS